MVHHSFPEPTTNQGDTTTDQTPLEQPTAPALGGAEATEATPTFRVGDYEVGNGYFSELSGHPDIVY